MICNLGDAMSLGHPVYLASSWIAITFRIILYCDYISHLSVLRLHFASFRIDFVVKYNFTTSEALDAVGRVCVYVELCWDCSWLEQFQQTHHTRSCRRGWPRVCMRELYWDCSWLEQFQLTVYGMWDVSSVCNVLFKTSCTQMSALCATCCWECALTV